MGASEQVHLAYFKKGLAEIFKNGSVLDEGEMHLPSS